MAAILKPDIKTLFADKAEMLKILDAVDARTDLELDPTATPEKLLEMMLAQGIRPEDNILSRDIVRARYEDEE